MVNFLLASTAEPSSSGDTDHHHLLEGGTHAFTLVNVGLSLTSSFLSGHLLWRMTGSVVQNSPSASPEPDPGSVETRATFDLSWMDTPPWTWLLPPSVKEGLVRPTGGAGPVGHPGDQALLPAGRLQPEALVLVGVPAGSAHRDEVFVALQGQRRRRRQRRTEAETESETETQMLGPVQNRLPDRSKVSNYHM